MQVIKTKSCVALSCHWKVGYRYVPYSGQAAYEHIDIT